MDGESVRIALQPQFAHPTAPDQATSGSSAGPNTKAPPPDQEVATMAIIKSIPFSLLLVVFAVLAASPPAVADGYDYVYYLSPSGDDKANGQSPATAWKTLTHACTQLGDGDTLKVGSGIYYTDPYAAVTYNAGTSSKPIVITSYNGTPAFCGPDSGGCLIIRHAYWIVNGLQIVAYAAGIAIEDPGYATIKNCSLGYMYDPAGEVSCAGIYVCADANQSVDSLLVTGCTFTAIPDTATAGESGEGIYLNASATQGCNNAQIKNNTFTYCVNGIDVKPGVQNCHVSLNHVSSCEYGIIYGSNGILERNLIEGTYGTSAIVLTADYSRCWEQRDPGRGHERNLGRARQLQLRGRTQDL